MQLLIDGQSSQASYRYGTTKTFKVRFIDDLGAPVSIASGTAVLHFSTDGTLAKTVHTATVTPDGTLGVYGVGTAVVASTVTALTGTTYYLIGRIDDGSANAGKILGATLLTAGSGYRAAPTVTVVANGPGSGAVASALLTPGTISSYTVTNPGSGYTSLPTLSLSGGGGVNATAYPTIGGPVTAVTVTNPSDGYASIPTASVGGAGSGAVLNCAVSFSISDVSISAGGSGYTTSATISFSGGGGSGAAATPIISGGAVVGVTMTAGGSGYTTLPTVTVNPVGGGSGAVAAAVAGTPLSTAVIVSGGTNYPCVHIAGAGTGAQAYFISNGTNVTSVKLVSGGTGYGSAPTVTIKNCGGAGVDFDGTVTATVSGGAVTGFSVTVPGTNATYDSKVTFTSTNDNYYTYYNNGVPWTYPQGYGYSDGTNDGVITGIVLTSITTKVNPGVGVTVDTITMGGGSGLNVSLRYAGYQVQSVSVVAGGGNYQPNNPPFASPTTVSFAGTLINGANGYAATATATVVAVVTGITVSNAGFNYTDAPTVTLTGGGGSGATAVANCSATLASITVSNQGSGYYGVPTISLSGTSTASATAAAVVGSGVVQISTNTLTLGVQQ